MAAAIRDLYAMTDEQVMVAYDEVARHTSVGVNYWMDELERRSRERSTMASNRVAIASFVASVVSVLIAIGALVVSLVR